MSFSPAVTNSRLALERILAGVSTRKYRRLAEPVGDGIVERERSTSDRRRHARGRDPLAQVEGYGSLAQLAIHLETDLIKRRHQLHDELTPAVDA